MSTLGFALIMLPPLIISVILHEIAHGLAAKKLGDETAYRLGRLTLNPISHIDPVMTLLVPGLLIMSGSPIVFGGAKPVPVNPFNLKNPKRDMTIVALAGPLTNFLLAGVCYFFLSIIQQMEIGLVSFNSPIILILNWLGYGIIINIVLAVFNLIPVPPLDGGRVLVGILPDSLSKKVSSLEPYGFFIIIGLLYMGVFDRIIDPILNSILPLIT